MRGQNSPTAKTVHFYGVLNTISHEKIRKEQLRRKKWQTSLDKVVQKSHHYIHFHQKMQAISAGEGIPYIERTPPPILTRCWRRYTKFTRQMLSKPDEYHRKPYKVKWLAEQGNFSRLLRPKKQTAIQCQRVERRYHPCCARYQRRNESR